ncbi:acyl carrier protein [Streptomyces sp. NPDC054796]
MVDMYRTLEEQITQHFNVPAEELSPQTTLVEAGLDSLALLELMTILESEYGRSVAMEDDAPGPHSTLGEVAAWLEEAFAPEELGGLEFVPAPAAGAEQTAP